MHKKKARQLAEFYRETLLEDTLPFWIDNAIDREHGGYLFCLDRDGTVVDTDKSVWLHGRFVWLLATLHMRAGGGPEWLDLARHGLDFLLAHAFDDDGRVFFSLTNEGRPLRKRRYLFSELFLVLAMAAYGKAADDKDVLQKARDLFQLVQRYSGTPGLLEPKVSPETRPMRGLGLPMIMINTAQVLRDATGDEAYTPVIDEQIRQIAEYHVKPDLGCVLETTGPAGEFLDHFDGRLVTPGHGIEAAWFIMNEARLRGGDTRLTELGCRMLDMLWEFGWDRDYGGIIYFRDAKGLPVAEYWHDMKFWWPQTEAIIATLMAHLLTGGEKYEEWHEMVHDYAYANFEDTECGEWFGYLHRDGRLSSTLKGNMFKGPFHLPRMQLTCWKLLEEIGGE
jgi:N-acylglucosamine 2-epimerase